MFGFEDVIGQKDVVGRLKAEVEQGRTAHALLLTGPRGAGKLPLALALARRLCCMHPEGGEACGQCVSCRQWEKLAHPDVHFVFPIVALDGTDRRRKYATFDLCSRKRPDIS